MRREDVSHNLSELAFEFFFWFSRFEFALKENGYLKSHTEGVSAKPGWDEFVNRWSAGYTLSPEDRHLLGSPPERQIVSRGDKLDWKPVGLKDCTSDLARIVRLLQTVRNNLFHGGKHGGAGWDDPGRTQVLLADGRNILDQLATLSGIEADYQQYY